MSLDKFSQPAREEDSWKTWLSENASRFFLFARQCTRNEQDAEDVLQDAIVESWRRSDNSIPDDALVFSTIRRRSMDLGRKITRREAREDLLANEQETATFSSEVESRETAELVESHLKKLKPEFREVVSLKIWGGLTFDQIGKSLNISLNTAASRYRYGIEQLRRSLKGILT